MFGNLKGPKAAVSKPGRRALSVLLLWGVLSILAGCPSAQTDQPEMKVDLSLAPTPAVVGDADISLKITDAAGSPLEGAEVRVEGNMNHAGMKPSFADLKEVEPGQYDGVLKFTMGGDWFLLVTAKTPDGKTMQRKIDVPGVKSK